jgi:alkane 1-monooxygenase
VNALSHLVAYIGPALLAFGVALGGVWTFLPTAFVFGLLPVVDDLVGRDDANPQTPEGRRRWFRDVPLWLFVPIQTAAIVLVLSRLTQGAPATVLETIGLTLSLGVISGSGGIVVAHELMHRADRFPRALAEILMTEASYAHFCIEHVHGHHRHVATPIDPASSRRGESVFAFVPRSIVGGLVSAWGIESVRVRRLGIKAWSLRDRRLRMPLVTALVYAAVGAFFGTAGVIIFLAQGAVAVALLEVINYLEHYGLTRREVRPGEFERVGPEHSWNSSHRISNLYLFNLARHSDHHYLASRPYEALRHFDEGQAPQLPTGYAAMLMLALVPPLWFRVMNPRVDAWMKDRQRAAAR